MSPQLSKSLKNAYIDLNLTQAYIIYPGQESFPLANNIFAVGLSQIATYFETV
jgi:hypothetical protein